MKKLNYLLLGLAGLTMASCSQDDILNGGADGNYAITVNLPADMATRASLGDNLLQAQNLHYAVFDMGGNFLEAGNAYFPEGSSSTTVPLSLAAGSSFQIAFFAQSPQSETDGVYSFNADENAHSITVNYVKMESNYNNADDYDCFYKLFDTGVIGSSTNTQVTLNRLVAQINWGTNDFGNATVTNTFGTNLDNLQATLSTEAYTVFDLITQEVSSPETVEIGAFTPNNAAGAPTFPVGGYQYVAMQYVLVPAEKSIQTLKLDVTNGAAANTTITVDNAPVQANFRTNIYGNLLTDDINFTVDLSSDWGGADYNLPQDANSLITALENGGNVVLGSDIYLPTFPTITKTTTLDLNGHTIYYDFTLPVQSDDHMIVVNGGNLTITGNGTIADNITYPTDNKNTLIYVTGGGTVNIENGDFSASGAGQLIYVQQGTANINGGSFKLADDYSKDNWCINCEDGTYNNTSFVNVSGGMFYGWNPADSNTEPGGNVSYLKDGYQSVETTINNETWYVVVPKAAAGETVKVATSTSDMTDAINSATGNTTIYVTPNTTVQLPTSIASKTLSFVGLDPETSHIYGNMAYWNAENSNLSFENITIESFVNTTNHTSMAFAGATSQTFNNVTFIGEFHVSSGTASFTDCTFDYDKTTGTNYALWCESNQATDITNCTMNCNDGKAILVYAGQGASPGCYGGDVNINGLTVTSTGTPNDKAVVEIHSEKYIGAGTITISNVTYPASFFGGGLCREIYNEAPYKGEKTTYYKIIVDGQTVQNGGAKGTYLGNGDYSGN